MHSLTAECDAECSENDLIPWYVKQIIDAIWLLHMLVEHSFAPPEPPMQETLALKLDAVDMDQHEVQVLSRMVTGATDLIQSVTTELAGAADDIKDSLTSQPPREQTP